MSLKVASAIDTSLSSLVEQSSEYTDGHKIIDFSIYEMLKYLQRIEDTFLTVGESQGELFTMKTKTVRGFTLWTINGTTVGRQLLRMMVSSEYSEKIRSDTEHEYCTEVQLWFKFLSKHGLESVDRHDWSTSQPEVTAGLLARLRCLVADIRAEVMREGFRDWRNRITKLTKKNMASMMRWLDNIFERHANLLVVRIDIAYKKVYQYQSGDLHAVSITEAFAHREYFLRALPKLVAKDAFLGYCIKTEYTLRRSIHHHCAVIVDASKVLSDELLAQKLGTYWEQEITQGRGECFNVNAKWDKNHPEYGLGRVHVSDTQKIFNLRHRVLSYLVKPDYLVRWLIPKRHRIFLKSLARPLTGTKPGRPRISKGI